MFIKKEPLLDDTYIINYRFLGYYYETFGLLLSLWINDDRTWYY